MITFVIFIISLALLVLLFTMKGLEIYHGRKIFLEDLFLKCDDRIYKTSLKIRYWWSHINFKNLRLIFSWIIVNMRKLIVSVKRRFDHKQSHFFVKREYDLSKKNSSTSFFLKDVSEYKKSLRGEIKKNMSSEF